jgi:hypothetical protein
MRARSKRNRRPQREAPRWPTWRRGCVLESLVLGRPAIHRPRSSARGCAGRTVWPCLHVARGTPKLEADTLTSLLGRRVTHLIETKWRPGAYALVILEARSQDPCHVRSSDAFLLRAMEERRRCASGCFAEGGFMKAVQSMLLGAALIATVTPCEAASLRLAQAVQIPTERQLEQIDRSINPSTPSTATKRKQLRAKPPKTVRSPSPSTTGSIRPGGVPNVDAAIVSENAQMDRRARAIDHKVMKGICRAC